MSRRFRPSPAMVVACVALGIALGGSAYAVSGSFVGAGGQIRACVGKSGQLTLIKPGKKCARRTSLVTWNQLGPRGPKGPPGVVGVVGPDQIAPVLTSRIRLASSSVSVPNNSETKVTFNQVVEDTGHMADLTNHPTTLVAPRNGVYLIDAELRWFDTTSSATSQRLGGFIAIERTDGGVVGEVQDTFGYPGTVQFFDQPLSAVQRLTAGQQIALIAYQTTGVDETLDNTDQGAFLQMTYLGR